MTMVLCRGCGKEIHQSALACPSCGATQLETKNVVYTSYEQVPWFRKNWFILLGALVFAPVTLYSLFTGDVYYQKNGQLVTYSKGVKIVTIILCVMLTLRFVAAFIQGLNS